VILCVCAKEGYSETTIERYARLLRRLSSYADLTDPESVKVALTRTGWADGTKEMACGAYAIYAKQYGLVFLPPRFRRVERLPFIPLDSEVEQLANSERSRNRLPESTKRKAERSPPNPVLRSRSSQFPKEDGNKPESYESVSGNYRSPSQT